MKNDAIRSYHWYRCSRHSCWSVDSFEQLDTMPVRIEQQLSFCPFSKPLALGFSYVLTMLSLPLPPFPPLPPSPPFEMYWMVSLEVSNLRLAKIWMLGAAAPLAPLPPLPPTPPLPPLWPLGSGLLVMVTPWKCNQWTECKVGLSKKGQKLRAH